MDLEDLLTEKTQVVELDWDAYFLEFQSLHGGEPVLHKPSHRLLFRDGWTYSATDTRGPEWPPPEDPGLLRQLMLEYWSSRRVIIRTRFEALKGRLSDFREMQRLRSAALQRIVVTQDEHGKVIRRTEKLDLPVIETQLAILENALDDCNEQIRDLELDKKES